MAMTEAEISEVENHASKQPNIHANSLSRNRLQRTARRLKISTNSTSEPRVDRTDRLMESTTPMEWLVLSLKILKLRKYVKAKRQSGAPPNIGKLDMMCDDILKKKLELISIDVSEDEFDQEEMTKTRAEANLSIAMADYIWLQQAHAVPKLVSAMRHIDSFELFKVTRDPKVLFVQKRRRKSVANQQGEQQVSGPFCWGPGGHIPTSFVVLSYGVHDLKPQNKRGMFKNSAVRVHSVEEQVTLTTSALRRAQRIARSQPVEYVKLTLIIQKSSKSPSHIFYPTMVLSGPTAVPYLHRSRRRTRLTS